jgi:hypothetical protein
MCLLTPQQETSLARPRPVFRARSASTPPGFGCVQARYARLHSASPRRGGGAGKKDNLQKEFYTPARSAGQLYVVLTSRSPCLASRQRHSGRPSGCGQCEGAPSSAGRVARRHRRVACATQLAFAVNPGRSPQEPIGAGVGRGTRVSVERSADFQVCRVAGFLTRRPPSAGAGLEASDTAGLETCATQLQQVRAKHIQTPPIERSKKSCSRG